jgi:Zinc finger, C2H2 type
MLVPAKHHNNFCSTNVKKSLHMSIVLIFCRFKTKNRPGKVQKAAAGIMKNSKCRSCLSSIQLRPIFQEHVDQIYTNLTSIQVNTKHKQSLFILQFPQKPKNLKIPKIAADDQLSASICATCSEMLQKFDTFKRVCWESLTVLRNELATDMDVKVDVLSIKMEPTFVAESWLQTTLVDPVEVTTDVAVPKASKREKLNLIRKKCEVSGQFQCPDCKKLFPKFASLRVHAKRHVKKCFCEICGEVLACQGTLRNHKITAHTDEAITRRFICGNCPDNKGFKFKAQLIDHMHAIHIGGRNFTCEMCSVAFKSK